MSYSCYFPFFRSTVGMIGVNSIVADFLKQISYQQLKPWFKVIPKQPTLGVT